MQVETAEQHEEATALHAALVTIPDAERELLELRFGLAGNEPVPLVEIGRRWGLSRERMRQLERWALERLEETPQIAALRPAA